MKNTVIIGASGFLGKHLVMDGVMRPSSNQLNLLETDSINAFFEKEKVNKIIFLAAICGGIGLNKKRPADLTHLNLKMIVNLFDCIRRFNIEHLYSVGSVCSYPCHCDIPFKEENMWNGKSEFTNRGYGEAKKMLITEFQTHKRQYRLKGAVLVPTNMFGPHDHFDLTNSHVIPALIRKFFTAVENKDETVELWGTGGVTREFLYVEDAAEAILKAVLSNLDYDEPINLGTGRDISIKELAKMIANLCGYRGKIVFNSNMPDGQPKRMLDVSRAKQVLGWEAKTSLLEGLIRTISWYEDNREG